MILLGLMARSAHDASGSSPLPPMPPGIAWDRAFFGWLLFLMLVAANLWLRDLRR